MLTTIPHNTVLQGHVLDQLRELPCDCVDVVVTSTPYYGLRDYGDECVSVWGGKTDCEHEWQTEEILFHSGTSAGEKQLTDRGSFHNNFAGKSGFCSLCGAWKGQLGLEPHPSMFIEHLAGVFLEVKRVLKPSGSLWLNLGDTYYGSGNGQKQSEKGKWTDGEFEQARKAKDYIPNKKQSNWLQSKQKMLIPARVAIALQDQGWILRNEVVWHKVNHMPESCRDRLTRSYESVFFFVKSSKYYFDLDSIRKSLKLTTIERVQRPYKSKNKFIGDNLSNTNAQAYANKIKHDLAVNRQGNFAYEDPLYTKPYHPLGANPGDVWSLTNECLKDEHFAAYPQKLVKRILSCACPKGGLVLDPFAGSGTSLLVAHKMGFDWLGIELVPKYCGIIEKRIERHGRVRLDKFVLCGEKKTSFGGNRK